MKKSKVQSPKSKVAAVRELVLKSATQHEHFVQMAFFAAAAKDDNQRLTMLVVNQGVLGLAIAESGSLQMPLRKVFGVAYGWLTQAGYTDTDRMIRDERDRQQVLLFNGVINLNCASVVASPERKLRVLAEEVGEVAEAVDFMERQNSIRNRHHLMVELVQVAAVCVAWLEAIENQKQEPKAKG